MENKQTAVQFLIEHIKKDAFEHCKSIKEWNQVFAQAKQMEKEQIIDAHGIKNRGGFKSNGNFFVDEFKGEQYYNETYGK